MAQKVLTMRKIKEILRLKWVLGLSDRQTGASLKIAHSTVGEYVKRAERAGLDWSQAENMTETELKDRLFPVKKADPEASPQPDWQQIEVELQSRGVTRMLLWQEYITAHPDGYGYSQSGCVHMCACSTSSVERPRFYGLIISKQASRNRTSMNPISIRPIMNYLCITGWQ